MHKKVGKTGTEVEGGPLCPRLAQAVGATITLAVTMGMMSAKTIAATSCLSGQGFPPLHTTAEQYRSADFKTLLVTNHCDTDQTITTKPGRTEPGNVHPLWVHTDGVTYITRNRNTYISAGCDLVQRNSDGGSTYEIKSNSTCQISNIYGSQARKSGLYRNNWSVTNDNDGLEIVTVVSDIIIHDICDVVVTAPSSAEFELNAAKNGKKVGDLVVTSTCSLPVGVDFDVHKSDVLSAVKEGNPNVAIGLVVSGDETHETTRHTGGLHTTDNVSNGTQVTFSIYLTNTGEGEAKESGRYIYGGTVGYWAN
ncbi:hypothetical protein NGB58_23245 [Escherichia coli]|nr:hypothetical protein [Escherichia coli]